jgi:hypothetical protein
VFIRRKQTAVAASLLFSERSCRYLATSLLESRNVN